MKKGFQALKRVLSLIMVFAMLISFMPPAAAQAATTKTIYLDAGIMDQAGAWFDAWVWGSSQADAWYKFAVDSATGFYTINVPSDATGMKVLRKAPDHSSGNWESWYETGNLDINTKNLIVVNSWTSYEMKTYSSDMTLALTVAGDEGLCGSSWDVANTDNDLTWNRETGLWEKVFTNVAKGDYQVKVVRNHSWDCTSYGKDGGTDNLPVNVTEDGSTVTIRFDLATKAVTATVVKEYAVTFNGTNVTSDGPEKVVKGSDYTATLTAAEGYALPEAVMVTVGDAAIDTHTFADGVLTIPAASVTGAIEITAVGVEIPTVDYYLIGYINGADYGCNDDYANLGDYKFVDGKLIVTFTQDSYVFIKTGDNANWYMTESYVDGTTGTFKNTTSGTSEKMYAPGGVELTYTLVENTDGTLTLSYTKGEVAPATYTIAGTISPAGWSPENGEKLTDEDGDGVYSYTYTNVTAGSYEFKVTNGSWASSWPESNYNLSVEATSNVTITFDAQNQTVNATVEKIPGVYNVTFNGTGVTSDGAATATEGNDYTATLTAAEGYALPETVTVTVGGTEITTPTFTEGVLTIPAASVTGAIEITAEGVEILPETKIIYLAAGPWDVDSAWYAAKVGTTVYKMVDLNLDGVYELEIPYETSQITFLRKDPAKTELDESCWNKTAVLTIGGNCYTITGWGETDGTWSDYTPASIEAVLTVAGEAGLCGTGWDVANTANDMAKNADGVYEKVYAGVAAGTYEYKVVLNHSWDKSWGNGTGNASVTVEEDGSTVIVTFDPATATVSAVVTAPSGGDDDTDAGTVVRFTPHDNWKTDDARFALYYFGGDNSYGWIDLTDADSDGVYEGSVPAGYSNVIFTRMNPGVSENRWNLDGEAEATKPLWNQTGNLTIPNDGTNHYTLTGGEWNDVTGTWETSSSGDTAQNTYQAIFHFADTLGWGTVNLYTWIGTGTTLTGGWPGSAVAQDANGFYTAEVAFEAQTNDGLNFIFNNGGTQTIDLKLDASAFVLDETTGIYTAEKWVVLTTQTDGKYNADILDSGDAIAVSPKVDGTSVTFQYNAPNASAVEVRGTMSGWEDGQGVLMTKNDHGIWSVTVNDVEPGQHEYKFVVDGQWVTDPCNSWLVNGNSAFTILDPDAEDTNKITVRIHYSRADGNYTGWNIWLWSQNMGGKQYDFEDVDGEKVASITVDGRNVLSISFIPRLSESGNEWKAQEATYVVDLSDIVSGTIDYYVTAGNSAGNRVLNTDVVKATKLSSVELDYDNNTIVIKAGSEVTDPVNEFGISNVVNDQDAVAIESVSSSGNTYTLTLNKTLDLVTLYQYKIQFGGYPYDIGIDTVYASDKFAAEYTYAASDLGSTYYETETVFRVWAPTAEKVSVKLYATGSDAETGAAELGTYEMNPDVNGTWVLSIQRDLKNVYYTYLVTVNGEEVEACDPYARATGVNGMRAMVIDLDSTDPEGWDGDSNPNPVTDQSDAIIYELHVRDFSIDESSGVSTANRGKFLAFTEKGTTTPNGASTGIDYLKNLGITHLHLLPVYDYESVDETTSSNYNWGYDPQNYNVPEGSYSTNPYDGNVRVNEMKQMVQSLHDSGISVVMDVVYNHVYDASTFSMNQIVPGYFSRVNSNTSGCGNDTASEREMVRKFIVESVLYWTEEYHIDGFRFDLVGLLDVQTINQIVEEVHAIRPDVIFYGEGWDMDGTNKEPGTQMAKQGNASQTPGFAYFSDSMRNNLGGNNEATATGFASGAGNGGAMVTEWMANPWWTKNPQQVVQYASCHDNYTLADKIILSTGRSQLDSTVIKMNNLAAAFYMTAQGVPFIHAGEELLREKINSDGSRNHNSYNSSDAVNHIQWSNLDNETYSANSAYYKGLIAFRKAHPALSLSSASSIESSIYVQDVSANLVSFWIDGREISGEDYDSIYVIFNANATAQTITLPAGDWDVCINGTQAGTETIETVSGSVSVEGISAMVLVQETSTEEPTEKPQSNVALPGSFNGWNQGSMMEVGDAENTYTMTLSLPAGTYEFKIKIENDWYGNSGTVEDATSATGWDMSTSESSNCKLEASGGAYTFTYNTSTKKLIITHDPDGSEFGDPEDYYLYGYINGADYAMGIEPGDYKFVDGKLTVSFESDSYVCVKNGDSSEMYMTEGWLGSVTSATMYNIVGKDAAGYDKLMVPGGQEVVFTLTHNDDDTVTLRYEIAQDEAVVDTSGVQDGVTLHCWNWSFEEIEKNMAAIAEMGFTAIQTSPVQPLKEATTDATDTVGGVWWVYYQPVDFVITTDDGNALGTKADLESMIETAHAYGIKVIVDVVANHLGNQTGNDLSSEIPEYLRKTEYWHDITVNTSDYNDRYDVTQHCMGGLPDLNTGNDDVQGYVLAFLKECVDLGVDGFRFDAAKHIETPDDGVSFASDFWPTVVGGAEEYAKEQYGKDLYIYGELLDTINGLSLSAYTKYMAITDNSWGNSLRNNIASGNAALAAGYNKAADADVLVLWAESHDTFATDDANQSSAGVSEADINKTWALVAARADAMGLYLARPESAEQALGVASLTGWDNLEVQAVNGFHNAFAGQSESIGNENGFSYVERGTTGVVLVNVSSSSGTVSVTVNAMEDGTYTDQITGNTFTVANGKITGEMGSTGIAVVYNPVNPDYDVTVETVTGGTVVADKETAKAGDTVTITVTAAEGKEIDAITVTDATGVEVTVTDQGNGKYSFTQPDSNVTVKVTFKNAAPAPSDENNVTVKDSESGSVSVNNTTPATGAVVTITPVPDEGVMVVEVIVKDAGGNKLAVTKNEDGTYSFTQPEGDVAVEVVFKTDYKIVSGNGSSAEHGSDESLTFKANGAFHKFTGVKVDGKDVDAKHYTAKAGSTIITMNASYLKTLSVGEHTITVLYTDGETAMGTFSLTEAEEETTAPSTGEDEETTTPSTGEDEETTAPTTGEDEETTAPTTGEDEDTTPPTGDESVILLWTSAMTISVMALAVLLLEQKRRSAEK